jgi:uncharacterized protein (DUF58 family)
MYARKGQAALDFLMTYGWAILLIVLIAAALFVLGIFDIGSFIGNKAVGFTQVAVPAFKVASNGTLTLQLQNQVGNPIRIDSINATYTNQTVSSAPSTNLGVGQTSSTLNAGAFTGLSSGNSYVVTVRIGYTDRTTQFNYVETGTLNGIVE